MRDLFQMFSRVGQGSNRDLAALSSAGRVTGSVQTLDYSTRTVVIPSFLADRLGAHVAGLEPDELAFTSPQGKPLRSGDFRRRVWRPAVAACELGDLRVHDLRHTAASLMISAGASIKAVQRALGHASAAISLDRYSHLYEDDLEASPRQSISGLPELMRPQCGPNNRRRSSTSRRGPQKRR